MSMDPNRAGRALAMSLAVWLVGSCAIAAGTKTYRDPVHKFSLRVPGDWEQVPVEPTEPVQVLKYYDPSDKGDIFTSELTVFRIPRGEAATSTITGVDWDKIPPEYRAQIEAQLKSDKEAYDYTFPRLINPLGVELPDRDKGFKKIRSADKINGKQYILVMPHEQGNKSRSVRAMLGVYEKDNIQYGIYVTGTEQRGKDLEKYFRSMVKSFLFFDDKAKDVQSLDVLADVNISAKRRRKIEEGLTKGWDVIVSPKGNYVIIYNTKNGKNKKLAKEIAERIEKIREQVYEVQFPPTSEITAVSVVRVCADRDEYFAYGAPRGSAGYWFSGSEELVFYDASPSKKIDDDTLAVLYHEAFHQYIFYSVGSVSPHSWFNEGHGDYYAGSKMKGSRFKVEPFDWRVSTVKDAVRVGPRSCTVETKDGKEIKRWGQSGYTPLADLVAFTQRDYYSYPSVSYAQGWSLIYFLREVVPKKRSYQDKWGNILDTYFSVLKEEVAKKRGLKPGGDDPGGDDDDGDDEDGDDDDGDDGDDGDDEGEGEGDDKPVEEADPSKQFEEEDESVLQKALRIAFEGVDLAELEAAWVETVKDL